jgi:hypothetical protein
MKGRNRPDACSPRVLARVEQSGKERARTIENDREKLSRLAASRSRYSRPDKHRIRMGSSNPHTDAGRRR